MNDNTLNIDTAQNEHGCYDFSWEPPEDQFSTLGKPWDGSPEGDPIFDPAYELYLEDCARVHDAAHDLEAAERIMRERYGE